MDINIIASSSSGNCYKLSDGLTTILIECGIPFKRLLKGVDHRLHEISACLVSHGHQDHCKAWEEVSKAGIDLYMTPETAEMIGAGSYQVNYINPKQSFVIGSLVVKAFEVQHDCPGSVGFLIYSKHTSEKTVFITDSYYSKYTFPGINYLLIECNNDPSIVQANIENGTIPGVLGRRLMESHFSIEDVLDFLKANDLSQLREIYLIHVSSTNGNPDEFKRRVMAATGVPVYIR